MADIKPYSIVIKNDIWSYSTFCDLFIDEDSFRLVSEDNECREYMYQDIEKLGIFLEYGIIYIKNGPSFLFKSVSHGSLKILSKSDFKVTEKIARDIQAGAVRKNNQLVDPKEENSFEISLIDDTKGLRELCVLTIGQDCIDISMTDNGIRKVDFSDISGVQMKSDKGCITLEDDERIEFVFGGPGMISVDDKKVENTKKVIELIRNVWTAKKEYSDNTDKEDGVKEKKIDVKEEIKDPLIIELMEKKPINRDYWLLYEESAERDGANEFKTENETGLRTTVKLLFQNAICNILLDKYHIAEMFFSQMKDYYEKLPSDRLGSTDFFRFYVSDLLIGSMSYNDYLSQALEILENRDYPNYKEGAETSFLKPGDKDMKKMYMLIDHLQYCRLGFLNLNFKDTLKRTNEGIELYKEIESEQLPSELRKKTGHIGNFLNMPEEESQGFRLILYGRMLKILQALIQDIVYPVKGNNARLRGLPVFFNRFINPEPKIYSYFSIEEEVQWGLIYYLSCRKILGLFNDLPHHVALRKFLG